MKSAMSLLVAIFICALAQGCGARSDNFYLNPNHQLTTDTSKIVILPIGARTFVSPFNH
jgi:hypothetical protein